MCGFSKRIGAAANKRMPVSAGKTQNIFHRFSRYYFTFSIPAKCQRIITFSSFKFYLRNIFKEFFTSCNYLHKNVFKILSDYFKKLFLPVLNMFLIIFSSFHIDHHTMKDGQDELALLV